MNFVFVDLEFLDYMESAAVVSMGIVAVDFSQPYTFMQLVDKGTHVEFNYKKQLQEQDRTFDPEVVAWWKEQSGFAKEILKLKPTDYDIMEVDNIIKSYCSGCGLNIDSKTIWMSRGAIDYYILRHIYVHNLKKKQSDTPWPYWNVRDMRTALHFMVGAERGKIELPSDQLNGFIYHNALHDACHDVLMLQEAFKMTGMID